VRQGTEHKATHRPVKTILWSEWQSEGLEDDGALASYLERTIGSGRYLIEPRDAHGKRVEKLATFTISTDEEEDDDMAYYDDDDDMIMIPRGGRRRRRRRGFTEDLPYVPEEDDDDPVETRSNIADMLTEQARLQARERESSHRTSNDMVQTMLFLSQQDKEAQERRREEDRRQEAAREQLKREEWRREEDRRAEEKRREEERQREERRREDDRRAEERRQADERSAQRLQMTMAAFQAAIPLIQKMLEGKPNTLMETILAKSMEPKEDATQALLLKHVLDKSQGEQSINSVINGMASVSKATVDMLQQQFASMQGVTSEMYQTAMKRALDVAMKNPHATEEDKGVLGQVMEIMSGAGDLLSNLRGGQPPQQQPMMQVPLQQVPLQQVPLQQVPLQQPPMQQPPMQQPPMQQPQADLTPLQTVGGCLMTIHAQAYQSQDQYLELLSLLVKEMPTEVRQALANGDETTVLSLCAPTFGADPELKAWITSPGTMDWLRQFLAQLSPQVEQMYQQISQMEDQAADQPLDELEEQEGDGFINTTDEIPPVSLQDITGEEAGVADDEGPSEEEDGDPNDPV